MMSSYMCRQCRALHIHRLAPSRNPQWQRRATFISLRGDRPSTDRADASSHDPNGTADVKSEKRLPTNNVEPEYHARPAGPGRYSRYAQASAPAEVPATKQDVGRAADLDRKPTKSSGINYIRLFKFGNRDATDNTSPSEADHIAHLLRQNKVDQAWSHFLQVYTSRDCPAITQPSVKDTHLLAGGKIFRRLLNAVLDDFCERRTSSVSPTAVLFKYEQLDLFSLDPVFLNRPDKSPRQNIGTAWRDTIGHLTDNLLLRLAGVTTEGPNAEIILAELLSVWKLLFQCRGPHDISLDSIDTTWQSLHDESILAKIKSDSRASIRDVRTRLVAYHPKLQPSPTVAFSAITIFNLLNDRSKTRLQISDSLRDDSMPFFRVLAEVLRGGIVQQVHRHPEYSLAFERLPQEYQERILKDIRSAPLNASILAGADAVAETLVSESARARLREEHLEAHFLKTIERAVKEQEHKERLVRIWNEVLKSYTSDDNKTTIPPAIYNAFLKGYLVLRAADHSVGVWNHMMAHEVKPDVKAWTAMLTGCEKARDLNGLNAMWQRMIRSGTQPDSFAWTSRVHGLVSLRQINAGFAAMDEMGRQWVAAEQAAKNTPKDNAKNTPSVPKPSVEVINGAISAIVQLPKQAMSFERKAKYVRQILQWGNNFSIKPDARTYNTLIKLYISGEDYATTVNLLKKMEADGVEPDLATYTMLIRASFDNEVFGALSAREQASRVTTLFSELEESGLKLNAIIYASVIDRLLKQYGNFTAVRATVDHMMSRGLIPNPHIYTSLITQYFQESPPNIEAVDGLWHQILRTPGTPTDRILFDRVMEGYASVGEIGKMMAVLTVMSKHGKVPSWAALTAVVKSLVGAGEYERARSVVSDVFNREGVAQGGITGGTHGHKAFLHVVESLRVLEPEEERAQGAWNNEANDIGPVLGETPAVPGKVGVAPPGVVEELPEIRDWQIGDNGSVGGVPL